MGIQRRFHRPMRVALILQCVFTFLFNLNLDMHESLTLYLVISIPIWIGIGGYAMLRSTPREIERWVVGAAPAIGAIGMMLADLCGVRVEDMLRWLRLY